MQNYRDSEAQSGATIENCLMVNIFVCWKITKKLHSEMYLLSCYTDEIFFFIYVCL